MKPDKEATKLSWAVASPTLLKKSALSQCQITVTNWQLLLQYKACCKVDALAFVWAESPRWYCGIVLGD